MLIDEAKVKTHEQYRHSYKKDMVKKKTLKKHGKKTLSNLNIGRKRD